MAKKQKLSDLDRAQIRMARDLRREEGKARGVKMQRSRRPSATQLWMAASAAGIRMPGR